jgi:SAM-dependent methyltransferase
MAAVRPGHYAVGAAGVALLRAWVAEHPGGTEPRIADLQRLLAELEDATSATASEVPLPEVDVATGYAAWAETYDTLPNPLIRVEEPVVHALLAPIAPGHAVDAACGTGRHAAHLVARGHTVIGIDETPEMLERARANVPQATFRAGSLTALPLPAASADVVVCALALAHVASLPTAVAELARVVRPGGRLIVSELHPLMALLGGGAFYQASDGSFGVVRTQTHLHADYVAAAAAAGLEIRSCLEPRWTADEIPLMAGPLFALAPDAFLSAFVGLPAALVWELVRR